MQELERGDPADILQNVRWQRDLYSTVPELVEVPGVRVLLRRSEKFVHRYGLRRVGPRDFPQFVQGLLPTLHETAAFLGRKAPGLRADLAAIERAGEDLAALQQAHRRFLLKILRLMR